MPIGFLLQGVSLGLTAVSSPGPLQTLVISQSLAGGWRRGAIVALAPLITDAPIVLLMLLALKQMPPLALRGLYFGGGLFVLYLAGGLWRQWRAGAGRAAEGAPNAPGGLRQAVLTNFLSPVPYTFWALVNGPILLGALRESVWHGAAFLIGFYGVLVGGYVALAGVFHLARRLGPAVVRGLLLASVVILAVFAVWLIYQGAVFAG